MTIAASSSPGAARGAAPRGGAKALPAAPFVAAAAARTASRLPQPLGPLGPPGGAAPAPARGAPPPRGTSPRGALHAGLQALLLDSAAQQAGGDGGMVALRNRVVGTP